MVEVKKGFLLLVFMSSGPDSYLKQIWDVRGQDGEQQQRGGTASGTEGQVSGSLQLLLLKLIKPCNCQGVSCSQGVELIAQVGPHGTSS